MKQSDGMESVDKNPNQNSSKCKQNKIDVKKVVVRKML